MRGAVSSKGNVLFLILVAVVLFAALSYAVTQSSRGGGSVSQEQVKIAASQIVQHAVNVHQAVTRMTLVRGVTEDEVCFAGEGWEAGIEYNSYNHADCADNENRVFHPDGGGVAWVAPDPSWMSYDPAITGTPTWSRERWIYTGDIAVESVGTSEPELIAFLGPITEELCMEINTNLGVSTSFANDDYVCCGWDVAKVFGISTPRYNHDSTIGDQDAAYEGVRTGCSRDRDTPVNLYYFWHVLIER